MTYSWYQAKVHHLKHMEKEMKDSNFIYEKIQ